MAKNSGITKGKSHKEGGIPMTVKSTGQKIEVEGGEGIVNKYAMSNTDKFEFEGKQKTSCEIISDLNQKKGDGVAFECDTVENKKYKFKKGGKLSFSDASDFYNKMEQTIKEANDFLDKYEYKRSRNDSPKLAVNVKIYDVNYGIEEALDTYQNRKGNFDMEKMRYVKKDLYLDEQWVYEQYNTFLDDTLYFFKEDLLADFGDVLKDKQIYQEGRMGGWLVFNDDGELATMVDELESILNNNFSEDGELVGYDRWGYDMEPVTFKEFKEEGDYDDAIYYAERIKYLLTDYEEVVDAIKTAHKNIPSNWKAFLDDKVDEHISENKKRYKIFTEDDPDFAKGGMVYDLRDMLINRGDDEFVEFQERQSGNTYDRVKEEYINETKAFTELYHTFKERLEDYHGEEVYAKGGKIYQVKDMDKFDKWFDETESLYGGFKKDEVRYEKDGVYISDDIYKESDSLNRDNLYAKGGMNKNDNIPKDFDLENAEEIRGDERLDSYVKEYYGEDADWTLYESEGDELERDAVAVDDFGNKSVFYIKFKKGGMTKNERVEKDFPKNPENITKDELHEHFDLNNDGKVTLEEYAEHIDYHCENPEVLEDELEQASYQRMFMYAKGGRVSRLEALNKWKKMTDQERSNKISRLYPKLSRVEALNKFQKLTDKERSDKVASLYAKGGRVKYLSDYINDKNSKLFEETGTFFAFSNEQFKEQMKKGKKYVNMGGGMITEKGNEEKLVKGLNKNYKEGIKQDLKENGKEKIILRELQNYEAFYTGDIDDTVENLKDYPGITKEDIMKSYRKNYSKYSDFAKGGAIYEGDRVKIKDSGKKMKVTDISKNKKDQVEFKGKEGTFLIGDLEKMAKGGEIMDKDIVDVLFSEYPGIHNQIVDYIIEEMDIIEKEIKDEDKVYVLYHNFNKVYNDIMDSLEGDDHYKKGGYTANVQEASFQIDKWLMIDEEDSETMNLWFEAIDEGDHEQIKIMIEDFGDDDKLEFYGIKSSKDVEELSKYLVDSSYAKGGKIDTIEKVDDLTNDIMDDIRATLQYNTFLDVDPDSDLDDELYSDVHNNIKKIYAKGGKTDRMFNIVHTDINGEKSFSEVPAKDEQEALAKLNKVLDPYKNKIISISEIKEKGGEFIKVKYKGKLYGVKEIKIEEEDDILDKGMPYLVLDEKGKLKYNDLKSIKKGDDYSVAIYVPSEDEYYGIAENKEGVLIVNDYSNADTHSSIYYSDIYAKGGRVSKIDRLVDLVLEKQELLRKEQENKAEALQKKIESEYNKLSYKEKQIFLDEADSLAFAKGGMTTTQIIAEMGGKDYYGKPLTYEAVYDKLHTAKYEGRINVSDTQIERVARKYPNSYKLAKGGMIKNKGYFVAIDKDGNALTLFQADSGKWDEVTRSKEEVEKLDLNEIADESQTVEAISVKKITEVDPSSVAKGFKDIPKEPFVVLFVAEPSKINPIGIQYWVTMDMDGDTEWGQESSEEMLEEFSDDGVTPNIYVLTLDGADTITLQEGEDDDDEYDDYYDDYAKGGSPAEEFHKRADLRTKDAIETEDKEVYELKDLAFKMDKFEDYNFDKHGYNSVRVGSYGNNIGFGEANHFGKGDDGWYDEELKAYISNDQKVALMYTDYDGDGYDVAVVEYLAPLKTIKIKKK